MQSWARGAAGFVALAMALAIAAPAQADVVLKADNGFVVRNFVEVTASPVEVWRALIDPAKWWSNEHTFSGDAANLTLDPAAGGCFCERLPTSNPLAKDLPAGQREGGVQHMRVIYAEPLRAMRMTGALGPLQSEALTGTLTMTLKPVGSGTRILWEYVVGGFMRYKTDEIAPAVDKVLVGQLTSLAAKLGPVAVAAPATPAGPAAGEAAPAAAVGADPLPAKPAGTAKWSLPPAAPKVAKARSGAAVSAPAAKPALAGSAVRPAQKPGTRPAPKTAVSPPAKSASRATPKPLSAEEIERRNSNAAFDAALGKAPAQ